MKIDVNDAKEVVFEKIRESNRLLRTGEKVMELRDGEKPRSPRRTNLGRTQNHLRHMIKQYNDILGSFDSLLQKSVEEKKE